MTDGPLVLGPVLRFVDETSATLWVETSAAAEVTVQAGDVTAVSGSLQKAPFVRAFLPGRCCGPFVAMRRISRRRTRARRWCSRLIRIRCAS